MITLAALLSFSPMTAMASELPEDSQEGYIEVAEDVIYVAAEVNTENAGYLDEAKSGPQTTDEECSIKLTFSHNSTKIDGAKITLTRVMGVNMDLGRYYPEGGLASIYGDEMDFDDVPAIGLSSIATEIAQSKSKPKAAATLTTDANGQVLFKDLNMGMYLVEQTGKSGTAEKYSTFSPFLITIPAVAEDGSIIYQIDCLPKTQTATLTDSTSETPPTPTLGIEFSSLSGMMYLFAGGALTLIALGGLTGGVAAVANRKRR